jgi:peptidoglycan hydrolase-like protein with peptidoglycan-binding domain
MSKKILFRIVVLAVLLFGFTSNASALSPIPNSDVNLSRIKELQMMIENLQKEIASLQSGQTTNSNISGTREDKIEFTKELSLGVQSDDVKKLQEILATDKTIYPEGLKTGYFGERTKEAIKRLQEKFKIEKSGVLDQTTIDLINKILESQGINKVIPPGLLIAPGLSDRIKAKMEFNNGKIEYKIELANEKFEFKSESDGKNRFTIELERTSGNRTKAKVDMRNSAGRSKRTFIFNTVNRDEVIKELANKLGLTAAEIESAIKSDDDTNDDSYNDSDDSDDDSDDSNDDSDDNSDDDSDDDDSGSDDNDDDSDNSNDD